MDILNNKEPYILTTVSMLSILIMNMLVFIIDKLGISNKKSIIAYIVLSLVSIIVALSSIKDETVDTSFNILSKKSVGNSFIYLVTQKGNGGNIKASITIENNTITKIDIEEQYETKAYYKKVEDANYLDTLIKNQKNISNVDTVTGATISSTALKKMVENR